MQNCQQQNDPLITTVNGLSWLLLIEWLHRA